MNYRYASASYKSLVSNSLPPFRGFSIISATCHNDISSMVLHHHVFVIRLLPGPPVPCRPVCLTGVGVLDPAALGRAGVPGELSCLSIEPGTVTEFILH